MKPYQSIIAQHHICQNNIPYAINVGNCVTVCCQLGKEAEIHPFPISCAFCKAGIQTLLTDLKNICNAGSMPKLQLVYKTIFSLRHQFFLTALKLKEIRKQSIRKRKGSSTLQSKECHEIENYYSFKFKYFLLPTNHAFY